MSRSAARTPNKSRPRRPPGGSKSEAGGFPVRVAAVDVGSNAMRLLAVEFSSPTRYAVLENVRNPVRLGHGVFLTGRLSPEVVREAVRVLSGYRERMEELAVRHHRAVATSAVREAINGAAFLREVRRGAGLGLEVIGGPEEARLVHRAVRERIDLSGGQWLLADLGGGSVEVTLADSTGVLWSESHTMGAVRLLEELTESADDPGRFLTLLTEYADTLRVSFSLAQRPIAGYVATGGNAEALAQMALASPGADGVSRVPMRSLRALIQKLAQLSFRERVESLGLKADRADVILPAALIYERLGRLAGADEILVPNVGVKEGVVLDLMDSLVSGGEDRGRLERELVGAAAVLGRKYRFDEAHGCHVARLSVALFDQLAGEHGLGEAERRLLQAAAILHDIGSFVSFSRHHRHSRYLIANSSLPGFSQAEMEVVANVARYHRRSIPKPQHEDFAALDSRSRDKVSKLAALLRLADAMDREHAQKVYNVRAKVQGRVLKLRLEGQGDLLLEGWALKKKSDLLKVALGLTVEVAPPDGE